jgi:hypothetical protein
VPPGDAREDGFHPGHLDVSPTPERTTFEPGIPWPLPGIGGLAHVDSLDGGELPWPYLRAGALLLLNGGVPAGYQPAQPRTGSGIARCPP